ncbi:amino acid/amide ABC transporter ATP-binding protein 2, HAAT family (TC 3.A.1.4.-) [Rhodococcus rhodochrous J3]|uniref:ABC transporter ATP-binding protein n=2 Tax=Rhodococcus rhodochrous TaxID=1829 RepID=A0AA46WW63_RHORH|nr:MULTISPECIES: ABC transporter ATP-binding protein [Rhodococcus]MBF4480258.1 ABC transporter ATP-binding protein [Rhodococcus rhodochrous]MCB8910711.1 ABC transporter ATP-binding protein [Rhodococcus rhodochrous]MDC3724338.1 ABC transporter ATP-binding protein [Rhodococcus sp. Rp3]MDJ0401302.1 ABC transporter ATP-binding protein [Rhodococcus rhodochrous]TWH62178.1 branched-chain amino acid transport system ATP-binding protein [Rhodococcus rhodochrous J38]
MIEIRDLHVDYGKVSAVRGVSVTAHPGRVTLVLGANGAGKTTTLRTVAGLNAPTSGEILVDGKSVVGWPAHRILARGVSLVPEGRRVFSSLTVGENLKVGGLIASKKDREESMRRAFEMFPILEERQDGPAGLLSGGEQQMLAFGRSLMSQPSYILMDEPSMGLAPAVVDRVMDSVRAIADRGIGVLMVEQNAEAGMKIADDVVVVNRGESVYSGPVEEARKHSSVVSAFLGEAALTGSDSGVES